MRKKITFEKLVFGLILFFGAITSYGQVVTSSADDGSAGTLRNQIASASAGATITFDPSVSLVILTMGEITIDKTLTLTGNGNANTIINGNAASRIFNVTTGNFTLNAIRLTNGLADNGGAIQVIGANLILNSTTIANSIANGASGSGGAVIIGSGSTLMATNSIFTGNRSNRAGGAIEAVAGTTVSLTNSSLTSNNTGVSPAVAAPGNGGALHMTGNGTVNVSGGMVFNNIAAAEGGGLWNGSGTMTVTGTVINSNTASGPASDNGGGGIYNLNGGTLNINGATITNNVANGAAGSGGGILNDVGSTLNIINSTINNNTANRAGGGIEGNATAGTSFITLTDVSLNNNTVFTSPGNGGGLHMTGPGTVNVNFGTVNNNNAGAEGGGLWNGSGTMTINGTIIDGNTASGAAADNGGGGIYQLNGGTLIVQNGATISNNIANGTAGSGGGILSDVGASLTVSNSSIIGNRANRAGGGIEAVASTTTTLNNVTLNNNNVGVSPAVAAPGNGGGFHITGSGNATINGGTVNNNIAAAEGGGLWNGSGTMSVSGTTIDGNTASGNNADNGGGGLYNQVGTLNVTNATVSNNNANGTLGLGGGILNDGATLLVSNSTVSNNTSKLKGGGIATTNGTVTVNSNSAITSNISQGAVAPTEGGGGIYIAAGTVNLTNASVSLNKAITGAGSGGGIFNFAGTLNATGSSITQNISNRAGGGIEAAAGTTTTLNNVSLNGNNTGVIAAGATAASPGNGGGFHITGAGNATVTGGTNNMNTAAQEGGALWNGSGTMTVSNSIVDSNTALGNVADDGGAGLFNNAGTLNLNNVTVTNNKATGTAGSGGGVFGLAGTISITNSTLNANSANRAGGAIEVVNGVLNITNSNLTNNDVDGGAGTPAPGNGGALHVSAVVTTTISGGNVTGNLARREGGGLWNQTGSTMTASNVKIDNNIAKGNGTTFGGGGIFVNGGNVIVTTSSITNNSSTGAAGNGGGVHVKTGSASITTTTISGNSSAANGGGIFSNAALNVNASTVANNTALVNGGGISNTSASVPMLKNTIVASNIAATDADVSSTTGAFTSNGYNLIGKATSSTFLPTNGDLVGTDAVPVNAFLVALANNGGSTLTHALLSSSPANNAGSPTDTFNDQLNRPIFAGRRDIGAFESQNTTNLYSNLQDGFCGTTIPTLNTTIKGISVASAQGYRFRITKVDNMTNSPISSPILFDRPVANFSLTNVAGITYNSKYLIDVSVKINNVWQAYGSACYVNTPNPVSTIGSQCGTTLSTFNQWIACNAIPKVTGYRFRVTQLDANLQEVGTPKITTQGLNKFNMTQLTGILYGTTYKVEVALGNTDGIYLEYNAPCNITTPFNSARIQVEGISKIDADVTVAFETISYPNPFTETFKLNIKTNSEENIHVLVYDMIGKLVEDRNLSTSDIETFEIGSNYNSGVYNIIVSQGINTTTLRVIKR